MVLAYWLALIGLSSLFLRLACSLCRTYVPTWPRAVVSTFVVAFLAYLVFDFSAYMLMRSLDEVALRVPPGYAYAYWFREPLGFKWMVISQGGPLRFLPIVFGLCAAGVLQVFVLQAEITFRVGLFIVLLQWGATFVAGYVLGLLFGVAATVEPRLAEVDGRNLRDWVPQEVVDATHVPREYGVHAWKNVKAYADSHLDDLKTDLAPLTRHLPAPVQRFLDRGGWWGILAFFVIVALLWVRSLLGKLRRGVKKMTRRKKKKRKPVSILKEDLAFIGDSYTDPGPEQVAVKRTPARLRLVVLSLGTRGGGELTEEMSDRVLDWIEPGLAKIAAGDFPRVAVWPFFPSAEGFTRAFAQHVVLPERKGTKSHWVLVSGQVRMGPTLLHVGLALYLEKKTSLRHISIDGEQWADAIGIAKAQPSLAHR